MAETAELKGFAPNAAYAQSFGLMANGTRYVDVKSNIDYREQLNEALNIGLKALGSTSGGAGTAGYALVPVYVDPRIVDRSRKNTPLVELIPRVSNNGVTADYNFISSKGGAFTAAEDAALSETNTTYDRASTAIKYLYSVGRVTGVAQASIPSYMVAGMSPSGAVGGFSDQAAANAKAMEVLVKAQELKELEENLIVNGNAGSDATQFSGIDTLQGTTNGVNKNTTALSLDDIHTAVQYAFDDGGRPNLAVCGSAVYSDLLKLLTAKIGYLQPEKEVFWGFSTIVLRTMVGEIPVVPSMFATNVSGSKELYFLDLSVWEMRVLQDMTYEELAKTNDSEKFLLKIYEALICKNVNFNAVIYGIA